MLRRIALGVASVLLAFAAPTAAAPAESDHALQNHQFIRISGGAVHPGTVTIQPGEALGWLNYSRYVARVSFDREVAEKLTCKAPGGFRITGERLESGDIQANQFASLCNLAAGEYAYRVELREGTGANAAPTMTRGGTVIVRP